ncbi:hypothetical protein [Streptomyces profundus]|uniref:hypothetical protein n=1 Tax=Streptomyces profundus TaxID=2867410 RepID=UPI001D1627A1|nr:hypothetical protein [Streptomyces sp. MA3_2.13]UED87106.1 hypothetical protein K4G22_25270 [Streptomyces sp. MA3_2.13]
MTILIIILSLVVLAALVLGGLAATGRPLPTMAPGGGLLRRRFGPEYERAVARHQGDTRAAHKELASRLRLHRRFRARSLPAERHDAYRASWARAQEQFVDSPAGAIAEVDQLLNRLIRELGYPSDGYGEQLAAVSVHHPHQVDGYRRVHTLASREDLARAMAERTEELRSSLLAARELFDALLAGKPAADESADTEAGGTPAEATGTTQSRGGDV